MMTPKKVSSGVRVVGLLYDQMCMFGRVATHVTSPKQMYDY